MLDQPPAHHFEMPSSSERMTSKIENCLRNHYHIDSPTISKLIRKLAPLIDNELYHNVINDFLEKSCKIKFSKNKEENKLLPDDPVLQAPEWHEVIFENPHVRVLWLESKPQDKEPFHTHRWKSLMLIIAGGRFEIVNADGSKENDFWPIGIYELPAETSPSAYTNIGTTIFKALRFEIKD